MRQSEEGWEYYDRNNISQDDIEFYETYRKFGGNSLEKTVDSHNGYLWYRMDDHCRYDFVGAETGVKPLEDRPFPEAISNKRILNPDTWVDRYIYE